MAIDKLLSPLKVGGTVLQNRVWMAPLTRSRAGQPGDVPTALNAQYYAQRATAGLIVTEATQISRQGQGYAWTPGMYTDEQEAGWREIVDVVHKKGTKISLQLWHVGRVSHHLLQEGGAAPVAPSAIRAENSKSFVVHADGTPANEPADAPRALAASELPDIVHAYADAARRAMRAGFDFVEVHAANGYLLNQFMDIGANQRDDAYGGSVENRVRLLLDVVDAVIGAVGVHKVGVRISPNGTFNDMTIAGSVETSVHAARELNKRAIAYLHVVEPGWAGGEALTNAERRRLREAFGGTLVLCGGYSAERAEEVIQNGYADAVAFGRPYIANPDLVARFADGATLNQPDPSTFYGGAEAGYTDYPAR